MNGITGILPSGAMNIISSNGGVKEVIIWPFLSVHFLAKLILAFISLTWNGSGRSWSEANIAHQLKKGTFTLYLYINEYHSCLTNNCPFKSKC